MTGRSVTLAIAAALYSTASALAQTSPAQTSPPQPSPAPVAPTQAAPTQAAPAQAAPAQMPSPTSEPRTPDITQLAVTPEQQSKLKELAGRERAAGAQSARLSEGATLPSAIELRDPPLDIGLGPYRYAVVGQQIVVVDPDTRSVIQVIQ